MTKGFYPVPSVKGRPYAKHRRGREFFLVGKRRKKKNNTRLQGTIRHLTLSTSKKIFSFYLNLFNIDAEFKRMYHANILIATRDVVCPTCGVRILINILRY